MKEELKVNNVANRLTTTLFTIYLIALYWILLLKLGVSFSYVGTRRANLIPFREPLILNSENVLNVVIFVPLGIYAGILFETWSFGRRVLLFFLLSLIVEAVQYIFRLGAFDVTDIITNTLGAVIGFMLFIAIQKAFDSTAKAQRFINIVATIGTVLMITLLLLLKLDMLPVRYK
jgi:glycopeptide antibiotics resistance protein